MEQINLSLPSKEFIEANFNKIFSALADLQSQIETPKSETPMYYRNKDLKKVFGLSDNTIQDYRQRGIIPFTKLGEIYYYPVQDIEKVLKDNSNFKLFPNS